MTYREHLHPPLWWALIGLGFVASVAVAVLAYLPLGPALAVCGLATFGTVIAFLGYAKAQLLVDAGGFSAGCHRLEKRYIAGVEAFRGAGAQRAIGPNADHRAFLFTRPFVKDLVRIDLDDPADPHPCWLISTRNPTALVEAITALKETA